MKLMMLQIDGWDEDAIKLNENVLSENGSAIEFLSHLSLKKKKKSEKKVRQYNKWIIKNRQHNISYRISFNTSLEIRFKIIETVSS